MVVRMMYKGQFSERVGDFTDKLRRREEFVDYK